MRIFVFWVVIYCLFGVVISFGWDLVYCCCLFGGWVLVLVFRLWFFSVLLLGLILLVGYVLVTCFVWFW